MQGRLPPAEHLPMSLAPQGIHCRYDQAVAWMNALDATDNPYFGTSLTPWRSFRSTVALLEYLIMSLRKFN